MIVEYLNSLAFDFHNIVYALVVGFIVGVAFATVLYLNLTSGIRITATHPTRYRTGDCYK